MKDCAVRYEKPEFEKAMAYCIARDLHSATDLRDTLEFLKQSCQNLSLTRFSFLRNTSRTQQKPVRLRNTFQGKQRLALYFRIGLWVWFRKLRACFFQAR